MIANDGHTAADTAYEQGVAAGREEPERLVEQALYLRMHGEHAPGGSETWRVWEQRAEAYLRDIDGKATP